MKSFILSFRRLIPAVLVMAVMVVSAAHAQVKPKIVVQPVKQSVELGSSVTFSAAATSDTTVSYQWRFNKQPIVGATSSSYTIDAVLLADEGSYDVVATSSGGAKASKAAKLDVLLAPASLPVGAVVYSSITAKIDGELDTETANDLVTDADSMQDLDDDTVSTFSYVRLPKDRATLTSSGTFYEPGIGTIRAEATESLKFVEVNNEGGIVASVKGKVIYYPPAGFKPSKITVPFTGQVVVYLDGLPE